ncbi:MAG: ASKHA domain-containing protein [bacterium]|nr:ASKHA domain-containing protein [bacterium]
MEQPVYTVTLLPEKESTQVPAGVTLRDAAAELGVVVTAPCGGDGSCGKCRVVIEGGMQGITDVATSERMLLSAEQLEAGVRLSCQVRVCGNVEMTVPATSRTAEMRVLLGGVGRKVPSEPAVHKVVVQMTEQTLHEPYSRLDHLRRRGDLRSDLQADLALLRRMPALLEGEALVTAVVRGNRLMALEKGDTSERCFGVALDLGTTTVVANLLDLNTGREMGYASEVNRQTAQGHDVIGRINYTLEEEGGLETLRQAALKSLNAVIDRVIQKAGVKREEVYEATVVGNATMMHLLLGISPVSLGRLPYVATVGDAVEAPAAELGLPLHPCAMVYALPNIAGFVGADTVGAILAAGLDEDDGRIRMVADIGTNCEIALRMGERLLVTSTPAGPAFEGARISSGMYAMPGAIEQVKIQDGEVRVKVIGGVAPQGLCGSGLVDAGAELLRTGVVDTTGRMLPLEEQDGQLCEGLRKRLVQRDTDLAFVLAEGQENGAIVLTQRDMRELQLAKGAIRTGIDLLLERAELKAEDLDEFCVAGGFGNYLDKENAVRLGLIPDLPKGKIRFIGNGALVGARLVLLSDTMRRRGTQVARESEHLQIAGTPDFQMRFSEAMLFEV